MDVHGAPTGAPRGDGNARFVFHEKTLTVLHSERRMIHISSNNPNRYSGGIKFGRLNSGGPWMSRVAALGPERMPGNRGSFHLKVSCTFLMVYVTWSVMYTFKQCISFLCRCNVFDRPS